MTQPRANRRWTMADLALLKAHAFVQPGRQQKLARPRSDARFEPFAFELPWPPSTNNLYANTADGGRTKTRQATEYAQLVCGALMAQRVPTNDIGHPCEIQILQHAPSGAGDVDNGVKIVLDCLKRFGVLFDDNRKIVKCVVAQDGTREPGGRLEIRISPRDGEGEAACA
jgi:Holliday junction resolvase RusA-like endonuclease